MPREVFDARLAVCFSLIYEQTNRLVALDVDVVIEGGFWKREQRRVALECLRLSGLTPRMVWFDVPLEELRRRLTMRNVALPPDTFEITDAMLAEFSEWFVPPSTDEGFALEVVR